MVLTSSSSLGQRVASNEALNAAIDACRVVLHEVRRRVDATITNTTAKSELRQALRLAESALTSAAKAPPQRTASASTAPLMLSSVEWQPAAKGQAGKRAHSDHSHSAGAGEAAHAHGPSLTSTTVTPAPPLPTKDEHVTRPVVGGTGDAGASADRSTSFEDLQERTQLETSAAAASGRGHASTADLCFPLCSPSQTAALYSCVLGGVFWRRKKLTESTITAVEALLRAVALPQLISTTLVIDPTALNTESGSGAGDKKGRRGGGGGGAGGQRRTGRMSVSISTALYYSLGESLMQSFSEPAVQARALRLLSALIGDQVIAAQPLSSTTGAAGTVTVGKELLSSVIFGAAGKQEHLFRGYAAIRVIETCFSVAVDGTQEAVRHQARLVMRVGVRRIVRAFVTMQTHDEGGDVASDCGESHTTFATDTILADYTVDVDHNEAFTHIHIVPAGRAQALSPSAAHHVPGCPLKATAAEGGGASVAGPLGASADAPQTHLDGGSPAEGNAPTAAPTPLASSTRTQEDAKSKGGTPERSDASPTLPAMPLHATTPPALTSQPIHFGESRGDDTTAAGAFESGGGSTQASLLRTLRNHPQGSSSSPSFMNYSFNPHTLFSSSIDESLVTDALSTLNNADGALPGSLKDLLMLLRRMCRYASRPCSGALNENNSEIRTRDMGLWMLESTLESFPVANCDQEHRCAVWMSLVMHACKYELLGCLARNLSVPTPFSFFERAVHVLGMLLRKLHYHLARELHTVLGAFLLPLMVSKYAGFRQKHAVLSMIRQLFAVPHLCVSFFVNYDCNPAFDAGAEYGGMLELLVEHVVEMTFLDHVNTDGDAFPWLTSDQQQLIRSECVVVIDTLMHSLHRWIAEDPQEYARNAQRIARKAAHRQQQVQQGAESSAPAERGGDDELDEAAELYLDNWDIEEAAPPSYTPSVGEGAGEETGDDGVGGRKGSPPAAAPASPLNGFHSRNITIVLDAVAGVALPHWGKHRNIEFHWKHIHYLLHNKRIAQEALQRINAGNWQEAKTFLESREFMAALPPSEAELNDPASVAPGSSTYALFAQFLFEYPGVSRDSLSKIFERVNRKDGASRLLLVEYLHCFTYTDVPIDVAMRDTTCKFMSWDRPMFESKVWETIQKCFGAEYARQNPNSITADDADTMAGVLLFLHSNLHNQIVKNNRIAVAQFVRDANDCLSFPMMEEDLHAMYNRVLHRKWELDMYGRTPQEAERERTLVRLSAKIQMGHAAQWRQQQSVNANAQNRNNSDTARESNSNNSFSNNPPSNAASVSGMAASSAPMPRAHSPTAKAIIDAEADPSVLDEVLQGADSESLSRHSSFAGGAGGAGGGPTPTSTSPPAVTTAATTTHPNASMDGTSLQMWNSNDVTLLDNAIPAYTDSKDALKVKDVQYHAFLEVSAIYLAKLESLHRLHCIEGEAYRPQPYIVPFYAEHVRQMLLLTYPHVMSCVYMGFRILEEAPIARKLLDTLQITYDIAAAFVLNLRDLRPVMEEALQRYLDDERAYKLLPPARATFVPFMLNVL